MPAGFQCANQSGFLQIDGAYKNLSLIRTVTVTPYAETTMGGGIMGYIAEVAYDPTLSEIIAIQGDGPVTPYWSKPGIQAYRVNNTNAFKYYVFGIRSDSVGYGIQVFNPPNLVFDSSWKPFNVASILGAGGSFSIVSGRSYATIFLSQSVAYRGEVVAENPFFWLYRRESSGGGVEITSGSVNVIGVTIWQIVQEVTKPDEPPDFYMYGNNSPTSVMVLDVTDY